jgi:hypothetical protein
MRRGWGGLAGAGAAVLVAGCAPGEAPPGAGSAAPSASVAAFDAKAYCSKACKRSAGCGVESAEAIARGGSAADKEALEQARTGRDAVEKACVDSCNARPPGPAEVGDARRAEACLGQPDCEAMQACLEKL